MGNGIKVTLKPDQQFIAKLTPAGPPGPPGPPLAVQDEGVNLPRRNYLNFSGISVTATDDLANDRTTVTISASPQTPWTSDIDGGGHTLYNAAAVNATDSMFIGASAATSTTVIPAAFEFNGPGQLPRWFFGTQGTESGSNAGSDLGLFRYTDAGGFLDYSMLVSRASGSLIFNCAGGNVTINSTNTTGIALVVNGLASCKQFFFINTPSTAADVAGFELQQSSIGRWFFGKNGAAEPGANVGSDFFVYSFKDDGSYLRTNLIINRSSGAVTWDTGAGGMLVQGPLALGGDINGANTYKALGMREVWSAYYTFTNIFGTPDAGFVASLNQGGNTLYIGATGSPSASVYISADNRLTFAVNSSINLTINPANIGITVPVYMGTNPLNVGSVYCVGNISAAISGGSAITIKDQDTNAALQFLTGAVYWNVGAGGTTRWLEQVTGTESGSDTGSDYYLFRFSDAHVATQALVINRATGTMQLGGDIDVNGHTLLHANILSVGGGAVADQVNVVNIGMSWFTSAQVRWAFIKETAETGANSGANLSLYSYKDDGTYLALALNINRATGNATFSGGVFAGADCACVNTLSISQGAANDCYVNFEENGVLRWNFGKNLTNETGSNAGSDFQINRYADNGSWISGAMTISRATGLATFNAAINAGAPYQVAGVRPTIRIAHTFAVMGDLTLITTLPSIFVPQAGNQLVTLFGMRVKIGSGTSVTVQAVRNGTNVGTAQVATTTVALKTLGNVALGDGDELTIVLSAPVGSPTNLSVSMILVETP